MSADEEPKMYVLQSVDGERFSLTKAELRGSMFLSEMAEVHGKI